MKLTDFMFNEPHIAPHSPGDFKYHENYQGKFTVYVGDNDQSYDTIAVCDTASIAAHIVGALNATIYVDQS